MDYENIVKEIESVQVELARETKRQEQLSKELLDARIKEEDAKRQLALREGEFQVIEKEVKQAANRAETVSFELFGSHQPLAFSRTCYRQAYFLRPQRDSYLLPIRFKCRWRRAGNPCRGDGHGNC